MAYKGCFLETSQIFKEFKGWRLFLKGLKEKMYNKEVLIYGFLCQNQGMRLFKICENLRDGTS